MVTQKIEDLTRLQEELALAFKWMGRATKEAQKGSFNAAAYDMTVALQHFQSCQHIEDSCIDWDLFESIDWKFFTTKALAMAKQKLKEEL
jgi:hypothetical protein